MGLYKRGQVWWMRFTFNGTLVRRSTDTTEWKLAERIYRKVCGDIAEGKWFERSPGDDRTFQQLMDRYLTEHSARNKAPTSQRRDKGLSKRLIEFFGQYRLGTISPKVIAQYKSYRRAMGIAPKTVNNELALMSHAFTLACTEWEWVKDNPVKKVSRERVHNSIERWLTFDEEAKLLEHALPWLGEIIVFAVETGLRQSELLTMQWSQVDLFRRTITLYEQKNKGKDTLPLTARAVEILKARTKVRHITADHVFFNTKGNRIGASNVHRAFNAAWKKAKIPKLRFHDLRHTFATRLIQNGVDVYTVQKLGRWKTIAMVMRYAHHHPESLRAGTEALDRLRERSDTQLAQACGFNVAQAT